MKPIKYINNFKKGIILTFSFIIIIVSSTFKNVYANEYKEEDKIVEEKKYFKGSVDDEFSDDKILVVLSREETKKYKNYSVNDFPEIDCKSITDLTNDIVNIAKNDKFNDNVLINSDRFNRILCLELKEKSKDNVIRGIKKIEKRNEVISAGPNYFAKTTSIDELNDEKI